MLDPQTGINDKMTTEGSAPMTNTHTHTPELFEPTQNLDWSHCHQMSDPVGDSANLSELGRKCDEFIAC